MLYSIVGILVIILDQLVKFWVDKNISFSGETVEMIPGVLSLIRVQNDGAAFSFLAGGGARIWFILLTFVFAILVVIALVTNFISGRFGRWCLVFITAGGISNMIDRVIYGFVIDMFKVELFDFAVFNVADIFITVFCIAFIIYILFGGEKEREGEADEFEEDDFDDVSEPVRERRQVRSRRLAEEADEPEEPASVRRQPAPEKRRTAAVSAASAEAAARAQRGRAEMPREKAAAAKSTSAPRRPVGSKNLAEQNEADQQRMKAVREKQEAASAQTQRRAAAARTAKAASVNDEIFEEMFATRQPAQRKAASSAAAPAAAAKRQPEEDLFAEWEKANAKVKKENPSLAYEKAAGAEKKVSAQTQDAYSDFIAAAAKPVKKAAAKPAKAAEAAAKQAEAAVKTVKAAEPAAKPVKAAEKAITDDFDLDSILDEFR